MNATEYVRSYIEAWNRQDSHAVADHLAENGRYMDIPVHQNMTREQLITHLDDLFSRETPCYELTGEVLSGKNTVAFQYKILPRRQSSTEPPETSYGAEFITLQDGRALEIADYYEQIDDHAGELSPGGVLHRGPTAEALSVSPVVPRRPLEARLERALSRVLRAWWHSVRWLVR